MSASAEPAVFMSYRAGDSEIVRKLTDALEAASVNVRRLEESLTDRREWPTEIASVIADSAVAIFFVGADGLSPFQETELREAHHRGLKVIPVLLPDSDADAVPTDLGRLPWIDLRSGTEDAKEVAALRSAVEATVLRREAEETEAHLRERLRQSVATSPTG